MYEARVVHHIPGRMRIKAPFLKGAVADLDQLNELLLPVEGLKHVDFSPITGSVLLYYDPALHDQFSKKLSEYVQSAMGLSLVSPTSKNGTSDSAEETATPLIGDTRFAREVYGFFNRINDDVKKATGDAFDLKSLLPVGIGAYAVTTVGSAMSTPLWITLAIFSFTSFAILNPVPIAVPADEKQRSSRRHKKTADKE
jgi:hypothetical protein